MKERKGLCERLYTLALAYGKNSLGYSGLGGHGGVLGSVLHDASTERVQRGSGFGIGLVWSRAS